MASIRAFAGTLATARCDRVVECPRGNAPIHCAGRLSGHRHRSRRPRNRDATDFPAGGPSTADGGDAGSLDLDCHRTAQRRCTPRLGGQPGHEHGQCLRSPYAQQTGGDRRRHRASHGRVAPNGTVWVANKRSQSISVINAGTLAVQRTISLPRGSQPFGIAIAPGGAAAYVALEATGQVMQLQHLDLRTNCHPRRRPRTSAMFPSAPTARAFCIPLRHSAAAGRSTPPACNRAQIAAASWWSSTPST